MTNKDIPSQDWEQTVKNDFAVHFPIGSMSDTNRAYMRDIQEFWLSNIHFLLASEKRKMVERISNQEQYLAATGCKEFDHIRYGLKEAINLIKE